MNADEQAELEQHLAALNAPFKEASADTGSAFDLPPDGDYQALVKRWDYFRGKSGQWFLKCELEVCHDPNYNGRQADVINNISDPDRASWLKKTLATLGADVENLDTTTLRPGSPILEALCDTPVEITVKTSDKTNAEGQPYRNVYVNRRLGEPIRSDLPSTPEPAISAAAAAISSDKIPF